MHFVQRSLHIIRKRAWEHKKALFHMNRAIKEMEAVYEYASHNYEMLKFSINEMKRYRAQENFEYQNALSFSFLKDKKKGPMSANYSEKDDGRPLSYLESYLKGISKARTTR